MLKLQRIMWQYSRIKALFVSLDHDYRSTRKSILHLLIRITEVIAPFLSPTHLSILPSAQFAFHCKAHVSNFAEHT